MTLVICWEASSCALGRRVLIFLPKLENEPPTVILNMTFYKLYTKTGGEKKPISELVFLLPRAQFEHATFIKINSEGNIHC